MDAEAGRTDVWNAEEVGVEAVHVDESHGARYERNYLPEIKGAK